MGDGGHGVGFHDAGMGVRDVGGVGWGGTPWGRSRRWSRRVPPCSLWDRQNRIRDLVDQPPGRTTPPHPWSPRGIHGHFATPPHATTPQGREPCLSTPGGVNRAFQTGKPRFVPPWESGGREPCMWTLETDSSCPRASAGLVHPRPIRARVPSGPRTSGPASRRIYRAVSDDDPSHDDSRPAAQPRLLPTSTPHVHDTSTSLLAGQIVDLAHYQYDNIWTLQPNPPRISPRYRFGWINRQISRSQARYSIQTSSTRSQPSDYAELPRRLSPDSPSTQRRVSFHEHPRLRRTWDHRRERPQETTRRPTPASAPECPSLCFVPPKGAQPQRARRVGPHLAGRAAHRSHIPQVTGHGADGACLDR